MTAPLGVLSVGPTAATTVVGEDVDGGPPWGCWRWVQHRPPPWLEKVSMAGLLGVLPVGPTAATTIVVDYIDGGL
jgi:hypothetical protein